MEKKIHNQKSKSFAIKAEEVGKLFKKHKKESNQGSCTWAGWGD